jgi:hypothetical protein
VTWQAEAVQTIDWPWVWRGAVAGTVVVAVTSAIGLLLDHNVDNFDSSPWVPILAVALLAAFVAAGFVGARGSSVPVSTGSLAGLGAYLIWLVVRVLVYLARESADKDLFGGHHPVFTVWSLIAWFVIAMVLGTIGARIGARYPHHHSAG